MSASKYKERKTKKGCGGPREAFSSTPTSALVPILPPGGQVEKKKAEGDDKVTRKGHNRVRNSKLKVSPEKTEVPFRSLAFLLFFLSFLRRHNK